MSEREPKPSKKAASKKPPKDAIDAEIETETELESYDADSEEPESEEDADISSSLKVLAALEQAADRDAGKSASSKNDDADDDDDDGGGMRTPSQIAGRRKNSKKKSSTPATQSIPAKVKKMMGDGLSFRFYKVDQLGKQSLVGDYTSAELANANDDIELFIQIYLISEYGDGGYRVVASNAKGGEVMDHNYSVLAPRGHRPSPLPSAGTGIFEQTQLTSQTAKLNALQEQIRQAEKEEKEELRQANEKQAAKIASMQGGGEMNMMSMFMMMQQSAAEAQMKADAADRRAKLELEKMRIEAQIAQSLAPPPMPLPPPPPPPDPMQTIVTVFGLMKQMMPQQPAESMELIYLRDKVKGLEDKVTGPRTLEDTFSEVDKLEHLIKNRYGDGGSNPAVDMVKGFMDNFAENIDSLKSLISEANGKKDAAKQLEAPQEQVKPPAEALPDGFIELIMELDEANDLDREDADVSRINTVLLVLQLFMNCDTKRYQILANQLVMQISEKKKKPVLFMLKRILQECVERNMITEQSSVATYKAFDRHFDQVVETVTNPLPAPDGDDEPEAPPAQVPPPTEPQTSATEHPIANQAQVQASTVESPQPSETA